MSKKKKKGENEAEQLKIECKTLRKIALRLDGTVIKLEADERQAVARFEKAVKTNADDGIKKAYSEELVNIRKQQLEMAKLASRYRVIAMKLDSKRYSVDVLVNMQTMNEILTSSQAVKTADIEAIAHKFEQAMNLMETDTTEVMTSVNNIVSQTTDQTAAANLVAGEEEFVQKDFEFQLKKQAVLKASKNDNNASSSGASKVPVGDLIQL